MIASFHLTRYGQGHRSRGMSRMAFDRLPLARTPGLRFAKMLGTGKGSQTRIGADLGRWALLAVWQDEAALEEFLAVSPVTAGWRESGAESWSVRLRFAGGHGRWGGRDPFAGMTASPLDTSRPVAILTRAAIRPRHLVRFHQNAPRIDRKLAAAGGCLRAVGIGELPVVRQATFSVWQDLASMRDFAYAPGPHRSAVRQTRAGDWFSEECFARFVPYGSAGTWDGADPLAG